MQRTDTTLDEAFQTMIARITSRADTVKLSDLKQFCSDPNYSETYLATLLFGPEKKTVPYFTRDNRHVNADALFIACDTGNRLALAQLLLHWRPRRDLRDSSATLIDHPKDEKKLPYDTAQGSEPTAPFLVHPLYVATRNSPDDVAPFLLHSDLLSVIPQKLGHDYNAMLEETKEHKVTLQLLRHVDAYRLKEDKVKEALDNPALRESVTKDLKVFCEVEELLLKHVTARGDLTPNFFNKDRRSMHADAKDAFYITTFQELETLKNTIKDSSKLAKFLCESPEKSLGARIEDLKEKLAKRLNQFNKELKSVIFTQVKSKYRLGLENFLNHDELKATPPADPDRTTLCTNSVIALLDINKVFENVSRKLAAANGFVYRPVVT